MSRKEIMPHSYKFQSKDVRDNFCRQNPGYRKSSRRNQVISPDYIADAGPGSPNEFGGCSPQYFAAIYIAEKLS